MVSAEPDEASNPERDRLFHQPDLKIALATLGAAVRPAIFIPTGGEIAMTNC
jgi:hypothetical protein